MTTELTYLLRSGGFIWTDGDGLRIGGSGGPSQVVTFDGLGENAGVIIARLAEPFSHGQFRIDAGRRGSIIISWTSDDEGDAFIYIHSPDNRSVLFPISITARERRGLLEQLVGQ